MKLFSLLIFSFSFFSIIGYAQKDTAKTYYTNGTVESIIPFDNGAREGVAIFYYENGNVKEERTYLAGKVEGEVKRYFENGKPKEIFSILKGKRDGATTTFDSLGNYLSDVNYTNGKLSTEEPESEDSVDAFADETPTDSAAAIQTNSITPSIEKIETKPQPIASNESMDSVVYRNPAIFPEPVMGYKKFYEKVVYPTAAKEKKLEGTVLIKAIINEFGDVEKTEIVKGIGLGCEDAAEISVSYTKFYPGLVAGKPVKVEMVFAIEFKLAK